MTPRVRSHLKKVFSETNVMLVEDLIEKLGRKANHQYVHEYISKHRDYLGTTLFLKGGRWRVNGVYLTEEAIKLLSTPQGKGE